MPPDGVTHSTPARSIIDSVDPAALSVIHFLEDERVERAWRIPLGVLIMTNLRCTVVSRRIELFAKGDWEPGPNFFFYNLAPPKALFDRFLRLSEDHERNPLVVHLLVRNPSLVAHQIQRARLAGQNEWLRRRAHAEESYRRSRNRWTSGHRVIVPSAKGELIRVRCAFCGNLMDPTLNRCPTCGAPAG